MRVLRFLFLPEARGLAREVRASASLVWDGFEGLAPPSPARRAVMALLAASMAVGCLAAAAGAQTIDPGIFGDDDSPTRDILAFLTAQRGEDAIGRMMEVFNGGVLVIAAGLLIWHTVTGTVETARRGVLGFGGWEIIRIVTAVALLVPVSGYNGAQLITISLARLGGDFATAVWKPFSTDILGYNGTAPPGAHTAGFRSALGRVLQLEVCAHVANAAATRAGEPAYIVTRLVQTENADVRRYDGVGRGMPESLCGRITYSGTRGAGWFGDDSAGIVARGHRDAVERNLGAIRRLAARLGDHFVVGSPSYGQPLPDVDAQLRATGAPERYARTLDAAAREAQSARNRGIEEALAESAGETSWIYAPTSFNTVARRIGSLQYAARTTPVTNPPLSTIERWSPQAATAQKAIETALADSAFNPSPALIGGGGGLPGSATANPGLLNRLFSWIDLSETQLADTGNPVYDLSRFGHNILAVAITSISTLTAASAGSNALEAVPWVGRGLDIFEATWQVLDGFATTILGVLLVAGLVLAYVIPAVPFIHFLFGILTWLVQVVTAVVAVTIFAAAHITRDPNATLMTGATRQGWTFLPAVALRPPLMVFGFILGFFLFLAIMAVFNEAWTPMLRDVRAGEGLGPVAWLAYLVIYTMVAYTLANICFKLVDTLPSAAMSWIGGGDAGTGTDGDRLAGGIAGGFGRAGGLMPRLRPRRAATPADSPGDVI